MLRLQYSFEMVGANRYACVGSDEARREFAPEQLGEHALKTYLDIAEKNPLPY